MQGNLRIISEIKEIDKEIIQHDLSYTCEYHNFNGDYIIRYIEAETEEKIYGMITIGKEFLILERKGALESKMYFHTIPRKEPCLYHSKMGKLDMEVETKKIDIQDSNKEIIVHILYDLYIDKILISKINIDITLEK